MTRAAESQAQAAKVAELKRLLASHSFDSLDKLEEAVDALMWDDDGAEQSPQDSTTASLHRPR